MSDQHKLSILRFLKENATTGELTRLSFNSLGKVLQLSKKELDALLIQLNKDRFINQYSKKGVDSFSCVLLPKALDAIEDAGF